MIHPQFHVTTKLKAATVTLAAVGVFGGGYLALAQDESVAERRDVDEQLRYALDVSAAFQEVARSIEPSVVNITTTQQMQQPNRRMPGFENDPFFDEFFERFFGPGTQQMPQRPQQQPERRGQGSGVIVSEDGFIVTNYHVIAQADEISVRLTNGDDYDAEVIGTDPETDLAVLRIEADATLIPATFGDSDRLNNGEWVLAVGNAFGFEHTVTSGIISATGRAGMGLAIYENFIQTDAAINPGNSGGPLVNLYGEVIGINTAIASRTGGYMGIGFAIPSNMAEPVVESIIERGEVVRGYLGITMNPLTEELAESFGYTGTDGVAVVDIIPDGPAAQAGLEIGDIIIALNDRPVRDLDELRHAVALYPPGTTIELDIVRRGEQVTREVQLGTRPTAQEFAERNGQRQTPENGLGLTVQEVTPQIARQLGMREARGVIITDLDPRSISARAGIRPNDIVLTVGNREIYSLDDYRRAMEEVELSEGVRLRVQRGNIVRFYVLRQ